MTVAATLLSAESQLTDSRNDKVAKKLIYHELVNFEISEACLLQGTISVNLNTHPSLVTGVVR